MGCSIHPVYGGWFAMRCVFLFEGVLAQEGEKNALTRTEPVDALGGDTERIVELLELFNVNWRDNLYRDVVRAKERYSFMQLEYFLEAPKRRKELIRKWLAFPTRNDLDASYALKSRESYLTRNFYVV